MTRAASGIAGFDGLMAAAVDRSPLHLVTPEDIGALTAFLVSDAGRNMSAAYTSWMLATTSSDDPRRSAMIDPPAVLPEAGDHSVAFPIRFRLTPCSKVSSRSGGEFSIVLDAGDGERVFKVVSSPPTTSTSPRTTVPPAFISPACSPTTA
jgi:hypothetical protein